VFGLDANRFTEAEAALINHGEVGAVTTVPERAKKPRDFLT
jgi:hypothetical protein